MLDKKFFFDNYRNKYGPLTFGQVRGIVTIIDEFEKDDTLTDYKWLVYALSTVKHECANTFQPIREYGPYNYFKYLIGKLGNKNMEMAYKYRGAGYVQLTGYVNYKKFTDILGIDLVNQPELALDTKIASKIMFYGMTHGSFTGKRLSQYFNDTTEDPVNARKIINGLDKAQLIAGYYREMMKGIRKI